MSVHQEARITTPSDDFAAAPPGRNSSQLQQQPTHAPHGGVEHCTHRQEGTEQLDARSQNLSHVLDGNVAAAGDDEVDAVHRRLRSGAGGGGGGGGERRGSAERLRKKADQVRHSSKHIR